MNASTLQPFACKIVAAVQRVPLAPHALAISLASTVAVLGLTLVTPVQAQSSSTVEVKDWDVYVDLPTRFAFVKTPTRWVFVRQLDEEQMTRLPPSTLTSLLKVDDSGTRYAHPALEPSPRVQALRAARTGQASSAARGPLDDPDVASAWRTLRDMACARCHGGSYLGSLGPSIVEFARTESREAFLRAVLDGEPARGMPGYRGNAHVEPSIDGIYRYFKGRADGMIKADDRPARP
jgi:mono/diheme cytochrome c family protein